MKIVLSWWKQNYTLQKKTNKQTNKKKLSHFSEKYLKPKEAILTLEIKLFSSGHILWSQSPFSKSHKWNWKMQCFKGWCNELRIERL